MEVPIMSNLINTESLFLDSIGSEIQDFLKNQKKHIDIFITEILMSNNPLFRTVPASAKSIALEMVFETIKENLNNELDNYYKNHKDIWEKLKEVNNE